LEARITGCVAVTVFATLLESRVDLFALTGALFLFRRNNRSILMQDDTDDINAVRINIPLSRVETIEKTSMVSFAGLISVTFDPKSSSDATDGGPTGHPPSIVENKEDGTLIETAPDKQVLQLGVLHKGFDWDNVMTYVNKAKASASESSVDWPGSRVYIDVDPRAGNSPEQTDSNLSGLVRSVSYNLGLDTAKEIWSTS
jgi:hypothetical protein